MRHINIPVFIPHLGCPNMCVFCNQRTISGKLFFKIEKVKDDIEKALSTVGDDCEAEIAFFGGSFTGIDRSDMIALLEIAKKFIDEGKVYAVRLSTRPDYIDIETLEILKKYGVSDIEIGVQSMSDKVLCASKRGHDSKTTEKALKLIKQYGFNLVGQMMIGLPLSTIDDEIETARKLCELGIDGARIYPTAVLCGTELEDMTLNGEYTPLSLEDAIVRAEAVLSILDSNNVPCIRCGLCASEDLGSEGGVCAGAYHPAFGELVLNRMFYNLIAEKLSLTDCDGKNVKIEVPSGCLSQAIGQKHRNTIILKNNFLLHGISFIENPSLSGHNVRVAVNNP